MDHNILVVDDEPIIRDMIKEAFSEEPYGLLTAGSAREALGILAKESVDVVISDEKMPGMQGSEFLALVRKKYPDTIRIILTGHANLKTAIKAINEGEIYRFFTKPCNMVDLAITIRQALQYKELKEESHRLQRKVTEQSAIIEDIEKKYPGITRVKRNTDGAVIIDDTETKNWQTLVKELDD
ncbi:MAG: response regulator [Deltaproteobacteria bacterium]|nr:response regulator [Deltaproteobacteria bacterium]MBW1962310.1 response regulator [Deltaproteobacteria bacterium]MBW2150582.1 response regulator [Deltaproteobacteria bacterium]